MDKQPKRTKKDIEEEINILNQHLRVFANALSYLLPENQGIIVSASQIMIETLPENHVFGVLNHEGNIKIDMLPNTKNLNVGNMINLVAPKKQ